MEEYSSCHLPTTLQCGHTFCIPCCQKLKKKGILTCPLDKKASEVKELTPNYEYINLIETSRKRLQQILKEKADAAEAYQTLQAKILKSEKNLESIQLELKQNFERDLDNKVSSAILQADEVHAKKLKRKLRKQEEKIRKQMEKEVKLKKEMLEKEQQETLQSILKAQEENNRRQTKEKEDFIRKVKKEHEEMLIQKEIEKKNLEEEVKRKMQMDNEAEKKKVKAEVEKQIIQEKQILEREAKIKEEEMKKENERKLQLEFEALQRKMQREMEEKERQIKEKLEKEAEERLKERERKEQMDKEVQEKMEKAKTKVQQKIKQGKFRPDGEVPERNQKESSQRSNNRLYWAFRTPRNVYLEYYDNLNAIIERAFGQGRASINLPNRGIVDFVKWREVKFTGEEVMIKRVNSFQGKAQWRFFNDTFWVELRNEDQFEVEKAWLTNQPGCVIGQGNFCDFCSLMINIGGKQRPLLRETVDIAHNY
jgi:hypothetical protein